MAAKIPNDIFQYSTTSALQAGYSSHGPLVKHLQGYGTHGIGVISGSNNKLLFLDSQAYEIAADHPSNHHGTPRKALPDAGLAFVMVTKFVPEFQLLVTGQLEKDALLDVFNSQGPEAGGKNSFIPFRLRGEFSRVKLESVSSARKGESRQGSEAADTDDGDVLSDIEGTVFGFIGPDSFTGVSVTGVHCCFLSDATEDDKRSGGGLVEFQAKGEVELSWAVTGRFHIGFPRGEVWEGLDIPKLVTVGEARHIGGLS